MAGVTAAGFITQRLPDIKAALEAALRSGPLGAGINLDPRAPLGQVVGVVSERLTELWELAEAVYFASYPDTAEGVNLDNAVALTGITRKPATKSKATVTAYGTPGTVIPVRSVVSVAGNATARFLTDAEATIAPPVNEVQTITFSAVPTAGTYRVTYYGQITPALAYNSTASDLQTALNALSSLPGGGVVVTGSFAAGYTVTFAGASGGAAMVPLFTTANALTASGTPVAMVFATAVRGSAAKATIAVTAETAGAIQAPWGSLTVIETPVAGWTSVTNATSAIVGQALETDAELRERQRVAVQRAGAGTIEAIRADLLGLSGVTSVTVFENTTMSVDGFGRPAKSFEAVVQGGDNAEIAQTIWEDKPAGIQAYGSTTVAVTDSQGFLHDVAFSRPTSVPIYVEFDLTTNADYPADGADRVKAQVLAYGATLKIGDDVIVYPRLMGYLSAVPGIVDVVVRIGTGASPTLDDNVPIGTFALASFHTSRITVAEVP